jgi:hypothetical protein
MLRRLRRRRLVRWVAFTAVSAVLFAGGIWLALVMAGSSPTRVVRVLRGASPSPPQYSVQPSDGGVRIRQQVGPGQEQEIEVQSTNEGVLIRPAPPKK